MEGRKNINKQIIVDDLAYSFFVKYKTIYLDFKKKLLLVNLNSIQFFQRNSLINRVLFLLLVYLLTYSRQE